MQMTSPLLVMQLFGSFWTFVRFSLSSLWKNIATQILGSRWLSLRRRRYWAFGVHEFLWTKEKWIWSSLFRTRILLFIRYIVTIEVYGVTIHSNAGLQLRNKLVWTCSRAQKWAFARIHEIADFLVLWSLFLRCGRLCLHQNDWKICLIEKSIR